MTQVTLRNASQTGINENKVASVHDPWTSIKFYTDVYRTINPRKVND